MRVRAEFRRMLLGLRGLALLRNWPTGDPDEAERIMAEIRRILDDPTLGAIEIDDDGVSEAYELWSSTYDSEPNGLIDAEERAVVEILGELPPGRAIDAACGTGRLAARLEALGHAVIGVDASTGMLTAARAKGLAASFVRGDLHALPLADAAADLAVCGLALTHVGSLRGPIAELARVVRPGGHVVVTEFHPFAVATGGQAQPARPDGSRMLARNLQHWTSGYVDAFLAADLEIVRLEEPILDERFLDTIAAHELREAIRDSWIGMPLALIWLVRRR